MQHVNGEAAVSTAEEVANVIRSRRTIHLFKDTLPPESVLLEGIDLACWAPNHKLSEPWHFHLIGQETAKQIAHLNARLVMAAKGEKAGANKLERWLSMPGWLAVTCRRNPGDPHREQEDYAACCCAVQNLSLYLWSHGIGMKWGTGGVTRDPAFFDLLGVDPETAFTVGLFFYGYPLETPEMKRKPAEDIVTRLP
jgi:nitroreductase